MEFAIEDLASKDLEMKENFKTEICRNWSLGLCQWGEKCIFAHGIEELRKKGTAKGSYKTKQCKQFYQTGYCIYGNKCQFMHKAVFEIGESTRRRLPIFVGIAKKGEVNN